MPIDGAEGLDPGEAVQPPGSDQAQRNTGLRLALAPAAVFGMGLILDWPLFYVGAVLAAIFTQAPAAVPLRAGLGLIGNSALLLSVSLVLSVYLSPYPVVYLFGIALGIGLAFRLAVSGANMLFVVMALLGALLVPFLVKTSPELGAIVTFWLLVNMTVAYGASLVAFSLFPAARATETVQKTLPASFDADRRLARMCLVTIPFAIVFFIIGSGASLTLIFVAILTATLTASTGAGPKAAKAMLIANVTGGFAAILVYESLVVAPLRPLAVLAVLAACVYFAGRFSDGNPYAGSALTTALILVGGSIGVFADEAETKMLTRLWQIGVALAYILSAFVIVDRWLPERKDPARAT